MKKRNMVKYLFSNCNKTSEQLFKYHYEIMREKKLTKSANPPCHAFLLLLVNQRMSKNQFMFLLILHRKLLCNKTGTAKSQKLIQKVSYERYCTYAFFFWNYFFILANSSCLVARGSWSWVKQNKKFNVLQQQKNVGVR